MSRPGSWGRNAGGGGWGPGGGWGGGGGLLCSFTVDSCLSRL